MLLPDNIHPELSIYYTGSLVLMELKTHKNHKILDLYQRVKNKTEMSYPVFILSLDWLYLIDLAETNENGCVELCL